MSLSSFTRTAGLTVSDVPNAGPYRQLRFHFNKYEMQLIDHAATVAYTTAVLATLGEGEVMFMGAVADLQLARGKGSATGLSDTWNGDFGVGTVAADNGATLATTEQDLIPTTSTPAAVAAATTAKGISTSTEAPKIFDGTATAKTINLNILVDDGDQDVTTVPSSILVSGDLTVTYVVLGDK